MIGKLLSLFRRVEDIGTRELADEIGISAATLSRIERGGAMDARTMARLIRWLFTEFQAESGPAAPGDAP